jgi:osmotically inducible protein OsmC
MAVESRADATWTGDLIGGQGAVKVASGTFPEVTLTWRQRAETRESGAAHAGCYSMALSNGLSKAGHVPERVTTTARVGFQAGEGITGISLEVTARVPGIDSATFEQAAEAAKVGCPVSKALAAVPITLEATLEQ